MSITTIEQVQALPEGTELDVQSGGGTQTWSWDGQEFMVQGVTKLPLAQFEPAVKAGRVSNRAHRPPEPGELWYNPRYGDRRYTYLIIDKEEGERVWVVTIRRGRFYAFGDHDASQFDSRNMVRWVVDDDYPVPAWTDMLLGVGQRLIATEREKRRLNEENQRLAEENLRLRTRDIDIRLIITGIHALGEEDHEGLLERLGGHEGLTLTGARANWRLPVVVTKRGESCLCHGFNTDEVAAVLPPNLRGDDWTFTRNGCDVCQPLT